MEEDQIKAIETEKEPVDFLDVIANRENEMIYTEENGNDDDDDEFLPDEDEGVYTRKAKEDQQTTAKEVDRRIIERNAKSTITFLNMINSRVCAAISKGSFTEYKINKEEQEELIEMMANYSEETGFEVNPHVQFWSGMGAIFGSMWYKAYEDREVKERVRKRKEVLKKVAEKEEVSKEEVEEVKNYDISKRKRFEVDSDNFYRYDENGIYIKGPKTDRPTGELLAIIERMKGENAKDREINQACRNYINRSLDELEV